MQLKFFNWEVRDSDRPRKNGNEQDRNGPGPQASSIFGTQRKKIISNDSGRPVSG